MSDEKMLTVKIVPRFDTELKSVTINTGEFGAPRVLPFDKKVKITQREYNTIIRLKNITGKREELSIKDIMEKYKVNETRAKEIKKQPSLGEKIVKKELYSVISI